MMKDTRQETKDKNLWENRNLLVPTFTEQAIFAKQL